MIIKPHKRVCVNNLFSLFMDLHTYFTSFKPAVIYFFILDKEHKTAQKFIKPGKKNKGRKKASKYVISQMIDGSKPRHYMAHANHSSQK